MSGLLVKDCPGIGEPWFFIFTNSSKFSWLDSDSALILGLSFSIMSSIVNPASRASNTASFAASLTFPFTNNLGFL